MPPSTPSSAPLLCAIPQIMESIRSLRRLLRLGGQLIFFEHGLYPDPAVRLMAAANRTSVNTRVWRLSGDPIYSILISDGGFKREQLNEAYLAPFPNSGSYSFRGGASSVVKGLCSKAAISSNRFGRRFGISGNFQYPDWLQQLNRIPPWVPGAGAGAGYGLLSMAGRKHHSCP